MSTLSQLLPGTALTVRATLAEIFSHAVAQVRGDTLIARHCRVEADTFRCSLHGRDYACRLPPPGSGRVIVVGAGKAAAWLGAGMAHLLGPRITDSCLIVKHHHALSDLSLQQYEAGHPLPDADGVAATTRLLKTLTGLSARDQVFVLLTGGASSLLVAPVSGISLQEKIRITDLLIRSGADIHAINTVRKHLSQVKGGGLLRALAPARCITLLISDVPGNDPAVIGSGPAYPDASDPQQALAILEQFDLLDAVPAIPRLLRHASPVHASRSPPAHLILGDNRALVDAACDRARQLGLEPRILDTQISGNTHQCAHHFCSTLQEMAAQRPVHAPPLLLIGAGETTLQVRGQGTGGRNQEFALVAAEYLAGQDRFALMAAGSDGTDGPTDAAGGFGDGSSVERADALGSDLRACLADNDSYTLLHRLDDLHVSGPTGTNVMDLMLGLALPGPPPRDAH